MFWRIENRDVLCLIADFIEEPQTFKSFALINRSTSIAAKRQSEKKRQFFRVSFQKYSEFLTIKCWLLWNLRDGLYVQIKKGEKTELEYSLGKKHGVSSKYYHSGKIKKRCYYVDGDKNGLLTKYYENGNIMKTIYYAFGKKEGREEWFYSSGRKASCVTYKNNSKEGFFKTWRDDAMSTISKHYFYENNKISGCFVEWFCDDKIKSKGLCKNGEVLFRESFFPSGKLYSQRIAKYKGKKLKVVKKEWHANGVLKTVSFFTNDLAEGEEKTYYSNSNIKTLRNYLNGKLHGSSKIYFENGQIQSESYFKNGLLEGVVKIWKLNGQLKVKRNYSQGILTKNKITS